MTARDDPGRHKETRTDSAVSRIGPLTTTLLLGSTVMAAASLVRGPLAEQYRPKSWDQIVGQDRVVHRVLALRARGLAGRAFFISGQSGTGKTTIARLIAAEVAGELATEEVNARDVDIDFIQRMEAKFMTRALAREGEPTGRAWILNEAHL